MIKQERINEVIDNVNNQYPDLGLECLTGLVPTRDEKGNRTGRVLCIQVQCERYNLVVGPVSFRENHFTSESMVEEFAESVVKDIRQWLSWGGSCEQTVL